jgi:hypothetical protein
MACICLATGCTRVCKAFAVLRAVGKSSDCAASNEKMPEAASYSI